MKTVRAFTLLEILIVLTIIASLIAILFPVFQRSREQARKTACLSNLRQIGNALAMYAQNHDDAYPFAADNAFRYVWYDRLTDRLTPKQHAQLLVMPTLIDLLQPFGVENSLWKCPSDFGTNSRSVVAMDTQAQETEVVLTPSAYLRIGSSYEYRLDIPLTEVRYPAGCEKGIENRTVLGPAETGVLADRQSLWHGGSLEEFGSTRQNMLFADGHVKAVNTSGFFHAWLCTPRN